MSVRVMSWVWDHSRSKSTARFVLLAIADTANDEGVEAYPAVPTLARKTRLSERAVQDAIKALVDLGELVVYRNAGPKGANKYRIVMTPPAAAAPPQPPHDVHPPAGAAPLPPQELHPTPAAAAPLPPQELHPNHPGTIQEPEDSPTGSPARTARTTGSRIPDDFHATPEMIAWARQNTPLVGARETESFIDYWRAKPGAAGRKLDWIATWRNWMRRAQADAERGRGRSPAPGGLVERDGLMVRPEFAERLEGRARLEALDRAREAAAANPTLAIEGVA